jgi:hypothetical protein
MGTSRPQHDRTRQALVQATLLGLLILVAISMALLALVAPDMNLELPATPEFRFSPPSPHLLP